MSPDTVTVHLEQTELIVHKALLSAVSPHLRRAFVGLFEDADEVSITLRGINEQTFRLLLHWAYVRSLDFGISSTTLDQNALLPPNEVSTSSRQQL
jgi:hypothetical protein